jgi:hypothetical protein
MNDDNAEPAAREPLKKDAWEDWDDELYAAAARELTADLRIAYVDANGQKTHRSITVERYSRTSADGGVLAAHCHLRQARRPFRFSRIMHAADLATATRIDNLGDWLDARYETTTNGQRDRFVAEHEDALIALLFVAKADDAVRKGEKDVIDRYCAALGLADEQARAAVVAFVAGSAAPSRIAFGTALRGLSERPDGYKRDLVAAAQDIVATDKTVRENELRALDRMRKELGLPA